MKMLRPLLAAVLLSLGLTATGSAYGQDTSSEALPPATTTSVARPVSGGSLAAAYAKAAAIAAHSSPLRSLSSRELGIPGTHLYNPRKNSLEATQDPNCEVPGNACTLNWSGLELWNDTFTGISADWTVPSVSPTLSPANTSPEDTSTWVGLDGDAAFSAGSDLIQLGTDSPSLGGSVYYEAWYELYPGFEIPLFSVAPGDQIEAVIQRISSTVWKMAISDVTTGIGWSDANVSYSASGLTTEWTEEATTLCSAASCAISPLQNSAPVTFTNMSFTYSGTDNSHSQLNYMVDSAGNVIAYPTSTTQSLTVTEGSPPPPTTSTGGPTAGEGSISGTLTAVTAGPNVPVDGACVYADDESHGFYEYYSTTMADGSYEFPDLVPGYYAISFDPTCGGSQTSPYAIQFYNGAPNYGDSTRLTVNAGQSLTGIDAVLQDQGTIQGTVDGPSGNPATGVCIEAYSTNGLTLVNSTVETGNSYTIGNLPADNYVLEFDPTCATTNSDDAGDAIQYYGGSQILAQGTPISVPSATPINATLNAGDTISGTVTAPGSVPGALGGICVYAYTDVNFLINSTYTAPDGSYSIGNLPPETYNVEFDPTCSDTELTDYTPTYDDSVAFGSAGVDASLPWAGGTVPSITTTSLPSGTVSSSYVAELQATSGIYGYTWTANGLPPGLTLSPGGLIFGTPNTAGTYTVTVAATDSSVPPVSSPSEQLTLTISPAATTTTITTGSASGGGGLGGGGGGLGLVIPVTTTTTAPSSATTTPPTTSTTVPLPSGTPSGVFGVPVTTTVGAKGASLTISAGNASAAVTVPPRALPAGTSVGVFAVKNPRGLLGKFPAGRSYLISFAVAWKAPNGTSPMAKSPIRMTITDPSIQAGDIIYVLTASGIKVAGVATTNGKVTVSFEVDPDFLIANVPQLSSVAAKGVVTPSAIGVKVGCGPSIRCVGAGTLTAVQGKGKAARNVAVAQGSFTVPAGKTVTVSFDKTAHAGSVLSIHSSIVGELTITVSGGKKATYRVVLPA
jgi:hypothetical protein